MLPIPKKFTLVAGSAEGATELNAFDNALLQAGIGNLNLLRVSSVLPPSAEHVENLAIPPGSLTPTAYGYTVSERPGETIAAAVAVGSSAGTYGIIMEHSGRCSKAEAETAVRHMVQEAFYQRKLDLADIQVCSVEHVVRATGCAFAAVALWY